MDVFFYTEESHAVVLAKGADGGGRSAPQGLPSPPHIDMCRGDRRPPGSSEESRLKAVATIGHKKRHPYPS